MEASGRESRAGGRRERAGRKHVTACALFSLLSSLPGRAPAAGSGRYCLLAARCELLLRWELSAVCWIVAAFPPTVLERFLRLPFDAQAEKTQHLLEVTIWMAGDMEPTVCL
jgi:hypothetical protein